jgi:large subunit ribosomal protein L4
MYRQKGTGRARMGSATSGTRVGGGRIFGPRPRDYRYEVPAKVRRLALRSAFSDRAAGESVHVVDDLVLEKPSTQSVAKLLRSMGLGGRKVLVLSARNDANLLKSCRNIPGVHVRRAREVHAYEVMWSDALVIEKSALVALEEVSAG